MTALLAISTASVFAVVALAGEMPRVGLSETVKVSIPTGESVRFALPQNMCGYPDSIRSGLARFLAADNPKMHLLGAAGDWQSCNPA